jgi:hypothetical protein
MSRSAWIRLSLRCSAATSPSAATAGINRLGTFLLNDEALANFGGLQIKKTHDVAFAVMQAYYGKAPNKTYIQGNSQGGHESLIAIQRWPADYDGAIVTHPANPFSALQLSGNHLVKRSTPRAGIFRKDMPCGCSGLIRLKRTLQNQPSQGSTMIAPVPSKSLTFRVTTVSS